jgi:hypothetical protein
MQCKIVVHRFQLSEKNLLNGPFFGLPNNTFGLLMDPTHNFRKKQADFGSRRNDRLGNLFYMPHYRFALPHLIFIFPFYTTL